MVKTLNAPWTKVYGSATVVPARTSVERRMTLQYAAVEDWIKRYGTATEEIITTLTTLSMQAEQQQEFMAMRKLQEYAANLEHLMVVTGRRRTVDPFLHGGTHPIERRAMRHTSVVPGLHWRWEGSLSADGVPLLSVPKGWPSPGVPHQDPSTGTTVVDTSYAPPERLNHTNHTTMAVYRALWFTRFCNPRSANYDPDKLLKPRQKLMKMCNYENCVNPDHYEKLISAGRTTMRQRAPTEVRALLPIYATEKAVNHAASLLSAGSAQYCRRGHQYEFDPETGYKLRCARCQQINNDNRVKKRQDVYQILTQRAHQEFPDGVASAYSYDPLTNELTYDPDKDPTLRDRIEEARQYIPPAEYFTDPDPELLRSLGVDPTILVPTQADIQAVLSRAAQKIQISPEMEQVIDDTLAALPPPESPAHTSVEPTQSYEDALAALEATLLGQDAPNR